MQEPEKIEGQKAEELLVQVLQERILVKVAVADEAYERLTVLTDIRRDGKELSFRIDLPQGLDDLLKIGPEKELFFEFTGKDFLIHRFKTVPQTTGSEGFWLRFPDYVQRLQLRDNFRVNPPQGSELSAVIDDRTIKMPIENLSLGGVLCRCSNRHKTLVEANRHLKNTLLLLKLMDQFTEIRIIKAELRRVQPLRHPKHFGAAYEFLQVGKEETRRLRQLIYELQRAFLKNRFKDW